MTVLTRRAPTALAVVAAVVIAGWAMPHTRSGPPAARLAAGAFAYQLIQEPDQGYPPVIDVINQAGQSVRVTMYELTDPDAIAALIADHRRGVDTKVLLDAAFHGRKTNTDAYDELAAAGVDVRWAPNGVIYHQKTITIDGTEAAIGTGNLTPRYYPTSRDAWVLDTNTVDVAAITSTFDADYNATPSGHPPAATGAPALIWSPAARATFLQHIDNATRSVDVTSEEFRDRAILAALDNAASRGVACRIVLTANPAWTAAVKDVSAAGCSVHLIPDGDNQLYMHEKVLLTDNTSLIIGSQNLTTASLLENRELSLQLDTSTAGPLVDAVQATFDNDYNNAPSA